MVCPPFMEQHQPSAHISIYAAHDLGKVSKVVCVYRTLGASTSSLNAVAGRAAAVPSAEVLGAGCCVIGCPFLAGCLLDNRFSALLVDEDLYWSTGGESAKTTAAQPWRTPARIATVPLLSFEPLQSLDHGRADPTSLILYPSCPFESH